jgi:ubiquinone/menaquinone biosynthesis C-methylase UbiE
MEGFINVDITKHSPHVDEAVDLKQFPWPWRDNQFEYIWFVDVLEHLPDVLATINECWRILQKDGTLHVTHVHHAYENYHIDPTHVRAFADDSFDYFSDETHWGQEYGCFYTPYRWRIIQKRREGCNIMVEMQPVK